MRVLLLMGDISHDSWPGAPSSHFWEGVGAALTLQNRNLITERPPSCMYLEVLPGREGGAHRGSWALGPQEAPDCSPAPLSMTTYNELPW